MVREWKSKTFKSGNSVALRLPKAMGFVEGDDIVLVPHQDGRFSMWKASNSLDVLMGLYGSMSAGFMKDGRGDIEQGDRNWDRPSRETAA